ncbi:hypothetical protein ES705_04980 [subsurface metagenome]
MSNYVQLNSLLDNEVVTLITVICFIILIFAMGFCLGRIMRIKNIEDKLDKELAKTQKVINEILEKAGVFKEINLRRGHIKP